MRNKRDDILHGEGIWGWEWLITNDTTKLVAINTRYNMTESFKTCLRLKIP